MWGGRGKEYIELLREGNLERGGVKIISERCLIEQTNEKMRFYCFQVSKVSLNDPPFIRRKVDLGFSG